MPSKILISPKNHTFVICFLVHACCDTIKISDIEEGQNEHNENKQNIHLPPRLHMTTPKVVSFEI